ncbi:CoA transferase subunit A [Paradesulfitobacterium ferrireducens]|uniref:CoA transferase subunit A n=1 Tax=Paradesulfitobacterium ferrireducens TaxID=2816476 RepID=UPI001A8D2826|nr:CoA-transferase [Paradesulfitobacterium ferrireducens]
MSRQQLVISLPEAAAMIKDGNSVGIGGFVTTNKPMALLREIMRLRTRNLTIIAPPSSMEVDMLLGLGMVEKLITPYLGAEAIAPLGPFHSGWAGKKFSIEEMELGTLVAGLRAHAMAVPFIPTRGVVGTSIPSLNPTLRYVEDPFGGPPLIAVPPIEMDVVLIHASQADCYGNVQHLGATFIDQLMAQAGKKVIVQVERIVSSEEIRRQPENTTLTSEYVDAVVLTPYGAHPMASQNHYRVDAEFIKEYVRVAKACVKGQPELFEEFVTKYLDNPHGHAAYLETVGLERLFSLGEGA